MDEKTYGLYNELVQKRIEEAMELKTGSEEAETADKSIADLGRVLNENSKNQNDYYVQYTKCTDDTEHNAQERELKKQQLALDKKVFTWKNALEIAGIAFSVVTLATKYQALLKHFKFEETGSVSSTAGRSIVNDMLRLGK